MKRFLILPLFVLVACVGGETESTKDEVGVVRTYEPVVSSFGDQERLRAICQSLAVKESHLGILSSTNKEYKFSYGQKNCDDQTMPALKDVVTTIKKSGTSFYFSPKTSEAFAFTDVETTTEGVMKEVCRFGGAAESPVRDTDASSVAIWWTTYVSSEHCSPGAGNLCIHIQTGTSKDGRSYKITKDEWIKFNLQNENEGFFIERKLATSAGCSKGRTLEIKAKLK